MTWPAVFGEIPTKVKIIIFIESIKASQYRKMNTTLTKIKLGFFPLLIISGIFITIYSFFYWLFYIQLKVTFLKEDVVQLWIPGVLVLVLAFVMIRPRIHLFMLDKDNGRIRPLYYMVAAAVCWTPNIFTLKYLDTSTGKLAALNSISEISQKSPTKYYTVSSYSLNKDKIGVKSIISYSGKHNEYYELNIYVSIPFLNGSKDTFQSSSVFASIKYHKQISSKISDTEKEDKWNSFWEESFKSFEADPIHFIYLQRMPNTEDRDNFILAARKSKLFERGSPVLIVKPIDEPFSERNGNELMHIFLSLGIGFLVWFLMILIPGLHEKKAEDFLVNEKPYFRKEFAVAYNVIKLKEGFKGTQILIGINLIVYAIMIFTGLGFAQFYTRDLLQMGALFRPYVENGEWWRLITSMFLHGGIMHLLLNMTSLYLAGFLLEKHIGTKNYAIAYLLSGIGAGLASLWWHQEPVVAVGASGAIFGLFGMIFHMVVFKKFERFLRRTMLIVLAGTAGYSLLLGFLIEGVDNSAHVGGLIAGFILGFFLAKKNETNTDLLGT